MIATFTVLSAVGYLFYASCEYPRIWALLLSLTAAGFATCMAGTVVSLAHAAVAPDVFTMRGLVNDALPMSVGACVSFMAHLLVRIIIV